MGWCPDCEGTGEVWEPCYCYQCEYDNSAHSRYVPCPSCRPEDHETDDIFPTLEEILDEPR